MIWQFSSDDPKVKINSYYDEISSILKVKDFSSVFDDLTEFSKNLSSYFDTYNLIYDKIIEMEKNYTSHINELNNGNYNYLTNIRQSIKEKYTNYSNAMLNQAESFKEQFLSFTKNIKNSLNNLEKIEDSQMLNDLINAINDCKNIFTNYYSNLNSKIDNEIRAFLKKINPSQSNIADAYENSVNKLRKIITENNNNEYFLMKNIRLLLTLANLKNYKANIASKLESQIKEDYESQNSNNEIKTKLESFNNEIESEANEFIEFVNNKSTEIDYYDQIKLYIDNFNYIESGINKTLFELYNDIINTVYDKISFIQPEYLDKNSILTKTKKELFDIAKNILSKNLVNSDGMTDKEISNYKNEMNLLLKNYNNTLYKYLSESIFTEILKNISITKDDFNLDKIENNFKLITEEYNKTYYSKNHSSFLENPNEITDDLNNFPIEYLKNFIQYSRGNINNWLYSVLENLYELTQQYIINMISSHKIYILSHLNNNSILYTIEGEQEIFDNMFESYKNLANNIFEEKPSHLKYIWEDYENFYLTEDIYSNPLLTILSNYETFKDKFIYEVENYFSVENNSWKEPNSTEKEKFEYNLYTSILNRKIFYSNYFLSNMKNVFDSINEKDFEDFIFSEPDLDYIKEDYNYNKSFYEMKDEMSEYYTNYSQIVYEILYNKFEYLTKTYNNKNYSKLAEDVNNLYRGNIEDFNLYLQNYLNNTNSSIYYYIEEYNKTLFSLISGYAYHFDNFIDIKKIFLELISKVLNKSNDINEQFNIIYNNHEYYVNFCAYIKNNISNIINERKQYFLNMVEEKNIEFSVFNEKVNLFYQK